MCDVYLTVDEKKILVINEIYHISLYFCYDIITFKHFQYFNKNIVLYLDGM